MAWATTAPTAGPAPASFVEIMRSETAAEKLRQDAKRGRVRELCALLPQLNSSQAEDLLAECGGDVGRALEKAFEPEVSAPEVELSPDLAALVAEGLISKAQAINMIVEAAPTAPVVGDMEPGADSAASALGGTDGGDTGADSAASALGDTDSDYALALELAKQERYEAALSVERENQRRPGSKIILTSPYADALAPSKFGSTRPSNTAGVDFVEDEPVRPSGIGKHDHDMCGLYNAHRLSTRAGVGTLDAGTRISGKVYNKMQAHLGGKSSRKMQKGMTHRGRVAKETRGTSGAGVLDQRTRQIVLALLNDSTIDSVGGVIATGKEASAFTARGVGFPLVAEPGDRGGQEDKVDDGGAESKITMTPLPRNQSESASAMHSAHAGRPRIVHDLVLKIFRTSLSAFKNRGDYVEGDARYSRSKFRSLNTRKALALWAQKEYRNLVRLHRAGVPVPEPLSFSKHCVVMRMIGVGNGRPAPQLREVKQLSAPRLRAIFIQIALAMRIMYQRARLVHGDLSSFNILNEGGRNSTVKIIDVGQSVDLSHPKHMKFLRRDCQTIVDYFTRQAKSAGVNFGLPAVDEVVRFVVEKDGIRSGGEAALGGENEHEARLVREREDKEWRKRLKKILSHRVI